MRKARANRAAVASSPSTSLAETEIRAHARARDRLWLPLVALITAMLCLPYSRVVIWIGDEGVLLHGADRMLQGSRLYADFFEFLPPGGFLLTAAWFSMAGVSFLSARILAIVIIIGIACFTYLACRQASRNAPLSAFLVIGWAMMSQGPWTQVSHHWFTTLFGMIAAWAALSSEEAPQLQWPFIAGAAAGAAAMITPTRGALATLAVLTAFVNLRENRAGAITYVLAAALAPVGLIAYLAANHSFIAAFDDVIQFTGARYAAIHGVPFGQDVDLVLLPLYVLFPSAAALTLLAFVRDWRAAIGDRLLRICTALAVAGFIGCFPHPDIGHIAYAAPLALPLFTCCIARLTERSYRPFRPMFAVGAIFLCMLSTVSSLKRAQLVLERGVVSTPRGAVTFVAPVGAGELLARIDAMPADDAYFFYPYMPLLPFLSARKHVAKYDIFIPGYTLPSQYSETCLIVMHQADWLIIDQTWIGPKRWKELYPAMQNPQPPETLDFERALDAGFELVARDETFELRRRRKDASDALCTDRGSK